MGVRHVGLIAKNPAALAAFYRDIMGMTVVGESPVGSPAGASLFLSAHPEEEDHEIVFFDTPAFAHTAFKVASLGELLTAYRQVKERGLPIKMALNHGCSLAFYFDDPEGNMIELYWATRLPIRQPYGHPIDLDAPEEELLRDVERVAQQFGLQPPPTLS